MVYWTNQYSARVADMVSKPFELLKQPKRERLSDQIAGQIKKLIISDIITCNFI